MSAVVQWICKELTELLGFEATEDVARYILAIETAQDLEDYMKELLDASIPRNKKFIKELLRRWNPPQRQIEIPANIEVYQKHGLSDYVPRADMKKKEKNHSSKDESKENIAQSKHMAQERPGESTKHRTKFVSMYSQQGQAKDSVLLSGRHVCECQATKHPLVNNCLKCGRVVCQQEGSGPCLFCGLLVCTMEEQEILDRGSKKSEKLYQYLTKEKFAPDSTKTKGGYESAMKHKDRLLEYDKTAARRTQVIDDEVDYFAADSNTWLSKEEKQALKQREEELRKLRHASRRDRKITIDFAGRQVIESDSTVDMYSVKDDVIQKVYFRGKNKGKDGEEAVNSDLVNPTVTDLAPQFIASGQNFGAKSLLEYKNIKSHVRLQDKELQEMSDDGMCLSMHQPWASLLITGIKMHEGRGWYSTHRGRLWIAATAKKPSPEELVAMEQFHVSREQESVNLDFPKEYPVGCLLGCVDVKDCLPQQQYREQYPNGESESDYVFICENPQELVVKFPIKGKHKIYKLDGHVHQGARKGLLHARHNQKISTKS